MHNNGKEAAQSTFLVELHNLGHVGWCKITSRKKNILGNHGTREPGNLELFFSSEFWWKNPRNWGLCSLFSRVLSQQNGELKKLLEIPVPWFPGSLASMLHTRNFVTLNPRQLSSRFANKHSKGAAAAWHSDYRGLLRGSTAAAAVTAFKKELQTSLWRLFS